MSILVDFNTASAGTWSGRSMVSVEGEPSRSFVDCLEAVVGTHDGEFQVLAFDRHGHLAYFAVVERELTIGDLHAFADGDVLPIDVQGRGGGDIVLLSSLIRAGMTFARLLRKAQDVVAHHSSAEARRQARDWMDLGGGEPSMALRTLVNTEREWLRSDFDLEFGLDAEPGGRLLRACGYRKVTSSPDTWVDEKE